MTPLQIISTQIPQLKQGQPLYNLSSTFYQSQGDESSIEILIFSGTNFLLFEDQSETDNNSDLEYNFINETLHKIKSDLESQLNIKHESGDFIKIDVSDHSIYFTIFYSGQY